MKVNHKQLYTMLKQQAKVLNNQLTPDTTAKRVNEIPENFNQTGWDVTIVEVEIMLENMKKLREHKGNRLTPQFYRSIYNRALIANNECEKLMETLTASEIPDMDYEAECAKLTAEIHTLNIQVAEKVKIETELAEKAKAEAEAAEKARLAEEAKAAKNKTAESK